MTEFVTDARRRLDEGGKAKTQADLEWYTVEQRAIMYGELKGYAEEQRAKGKEYKPNWAACKFKARFGYYPTREIEATPTFDCGPETRAWIDATNRNFWRTQKRRKP